MKYFIYVLIAIAIGLMGYNTTHIDFENLTADTNKTALIGVIAPACVIVLLLILLISRKIQNTKKRR